MKDRKPKCSNNEKHTVKLNYEFDAYYCIECNSWIEGKCGEFDCWACSKRPELPSMCEEWED